MTLVGSGAFTYEVQQNWFELPEAGTLAGCQPWPAIPPIASMCTAAASVP